MSDTRSGSETAAAPTRGKGANIALWVLQVLLALSFLSAAFQKLGSTDQMVDIFDRIGFGTWFMYAIGVIELLGAVALVIPLLSGAAAVGLVLLTVGATITHLVIDENPLIPLAFALPTLVVVWGRWPQFTALIRRFGIGT